MKQLGHFINTISTTVFRTISYPCCLLFLLLVASPSAAVESDISRMDSVEIGIVTCTPHEEVYSLYGHTAIRYHNLRTGQDLVFNYGVFDFKKPHFVTRFVLGKTDYELGVFPLEPFCEYYRKWGSCIIEQVLNLTNEDKANITYALSLNLRPENRIYRYNFFYDNCSTRPRDIIERNMTGKVILDKREGDEQSYREMIHELVDHHPWAALGNDLLLGVNADKKPDRRQQQFLPLHLMYDYDHAQILQNGEYRPLVKERRTLVEPGVQTIEEDFPLSPTICWATLLVVCLCIMVFEWRARRRFKWFDVLLMVPMGIAGILLFIMIFSEHPATSINLQILLFNPLYLFFIPAIVRSKQTRYWTVMLASVCLFLLGGLLQDYAEGVEILALCLLTRYWSHIKNDK